MLKAVLETTFLHFNRAKSYYQELCNQAISADIYQNPELVKTIDAFILRFIKLQDFMGDKLFKEILRNVGEYKDSMSLIDCLDKLEKLEIINSAGQWLQYRTLRNNLTHEYPDNQTAIIEGIQLALIYFAEISLLLEHIVNYIHTKNLIAHSDQP